MYLSQNKKSGSVLLTAAILLAVLGGLIISVLRVVNSSIKTMKTIDSVEKERKDNYNWLSFIHNGDMCSRLSITMQAYDPAARLQLSDEADESSAAADGTWIGWDNPHLLREEMDRIDYIDGPFMRKWIVAVTPSPLSPDFNPNHNIKKFVINQVKVAKNGFSQITLGAWSHPIGATPSRLLWQTGLNVFYENVGSPVRKEILRCFGFQSPEFLCKSEGRVWSISNRKCTTPGPSPNWWAP